MTHEKKNELHQILEDEIYYLTDNFYKQKQIVLYGAVRLGELASNLIKTSGLSIAYFVDKNYKNKTSVAEIEVFHLEKLTELNKGKNIVLISAFKFPYNKIKSIIRKYSDVDIYSVYDLLLFLNKAYFTNGWYSGCLTRIDKENIKFVYDRLGDQFSKETYLNFLKWRISHKENNLSENNIINEDTKYFNNLTISSLSKPGIVLDVGAFDLSFSLEALDKNESIENIIAFEPDNESYNECIKILIQKPSKLEKISLFKTAISNNSREQAFVHGHGLASRLVEEDKEIFKSIKTINLDEFIYSGNYKSEITAIKLHIEGKELNALLGAKNLIKNYRPLLMINCSHNRDGLWKIPYYMMQYKDYRFYMRSHAFYGEGLTFYAVPI